MTRRIRDVLASLLGIYLLLLAFFGALSGPPVEMPEWIPLVLMALAFLGVTVLGPAKYLEWRRRRSTAVTPDDAPANPSREPGAASRMPGAPPTDQ